MKKILLVEDDVSILNGLNFFLKKEGFNIDTASNLSEARKLILLKTFDLLVLDVNLPDGSGFDLVKEIRDVSDLPIIFLTARDDQDDIIEGLKIGGDDYITKPFSLKVLSLKIDSILARKSATKEAKILKSGGIVLDLVSHIAKKGDKDLELTPSEFKLLHIFMDNVEKAINREDILKELWDTNQDLRGNNTVSVYIKRLREKIEDDMREPTYIKTVRNIGYIWDKEVTFE